jgi:ectoine hydroxylase-related dioxygenase (phytanoyl-CoA dioxygenase family)
MDLREHGVTVVPGVLDRAMLERVRARVATLLANLPAEHRAARRATGSLVHIAADPFFAELIAWPAALAALERLGLPDARFSSGYLISKPPGGPPLFWHQDWWGWDDPLSYQPEPLQVFLMYYLADTDPASGCLRVVPGSHRRRHALHDILPDAHEGELSRAGDLAHPAFRTAPGEVEVPVAAGDLVIGDARLLHAAHANNGAAERPLITLWYHPRFAGQPPAIRARVARVLRREGVDTDPGGAVAAPFPDSWPAEARARIAPLLATDGGTAEPQPWNRVPDAARLAP